MGEHVSLQPVQLEAQDESALERDILVSPWGDPFLSHTKGQSVWVGAALGGQIRQGSREGTCDSRLCLASGRGLFGPGFVCVQESNCGRD